MKINSTGLYALLLLLLIIKVSSSCTPETCIGETNAFAKITFYNSTTNKLLSASDSVTIFGTGRDTAKLYNKASAVSLANLPLDSSKDTCGFVVKMNNLTDTLTFIYSSYPHLISKECGISFFHTLDTVLSTGNSLKTIVIKNKNITTSIVENIRIYY